MLPPVKNKKVLDAGCAAGWYTEWLLNQGAEVTVIDFSPEMIKMTEKRVGSRAKIIQADLNQPLDFIKDQELDLIISSLTLHYIKDWEPVMAEFNRILKKSGSLVFLSITHSWTSQYLIETTISQQNS
ncbi:class I SAM-dependent methyltransferase [Halonatronomonas betaini]|uniref:class I SAM-dependent methyltransferase n=1 Tax=Halonatronomonas betaini TaxID=2778430 RepID=UPI0022E13682|nr:class I SAM-dependent methyltransferase [Halonatronomonas betaini]